MVSAIEGVQAKEQEADGVVASLGERVRGDFPILDQVRLSGVGMLRRVLVLGVVVRVTLECGPQFRLRSCIVCKHAHEKCHGGP